MRSLRRVTLLTLVGLLTSVGIVGAVWAYVSARMEAGEFLDLQQQQVARFVGDLSFVPPKNAALPPHEKEDDYVVAVTYRDGRPAQTSNPKIAIPDATETGFSELRQNGVTWRVFSLVTAGRTVQVAQQMAVRRELAAGAAAQAALPLLVALPLSWLLLGLITARIFARLERVADGIARRDSADTTPIPLEQVPSEILPLVEAVNDLLERLRVAMQRQKAFLSDAAHELRTPLTAITLQIGNLRGAIPDDPALAERLDDIEAGARRAAALTHQLLRIARYDAEADRPRAQDRVCLDDLVTEVVAGLVPLAESRSIDLGILERQPATVTGRAADLRTMIEVLVDNAVRYTAEGGTVDVGLGRQDGSPAVVVSDTGPGVRDELLPRLAERFVRGQPGDSEGSGLGLAIAQAIAVRHGVALTLANRRDRAGFEATLRFVGEAGPAAPHG